MSVPEVIDQQTGELVPVSGNSGNLLGTSDPIEHLRRARRHADELVAVIREKHLYKTIRGKNHVQVEAWTLLGSMLGVFPILEDTERVEIDGARGWRATVSAKTLAGVTVGRAAALCMTNESRGGKQLWKDADEHDLLAMAQTRATRNALKGPLGFIVQLAGYDPEERAAEETNEVSSEQHRKLAKTLQECAAKEEGGSEEEWQERAHDYACATYGVQSRSELTAKEMGDVIDHFEQIAKA